MKIGDRRVALVSGAALLLATTALVSPALAQTVGGGTGLPTQKAALDLMGLHGAGKANALAEVAACLCLAGEISIMAAIAARHFTRAHDKLARQRA